MMDLVQLDFFFTFEKRASIKNAQYFSSSQVLWLKPLRFELVAMKCSIQCTLASVKAAPKSTTDAFAQLGRSFLAFGLPTFAVA